MRKRALAVLGTLLAVLVATCLAILLRGDGGSDGSVDPRSVERRLEREARRQGLQPHAVQCVRAEDLPRSFDCFVEGADDLHLAYRVTVARDGALVVRAPEGP